MANHYISINRGKQGFADNDFTYGTSSVSGDDLEIRIADAAGWTRQEIIQKLDEIGRFLVQSSNITGTKFPPQ